MLQDAKSLSFKLLLGFLLMSLCFVIAWFITKTNFNSIRNSVNAIAMPNAANLLSNKLFKDIVLVDQLEKQSFEKPLNEEQNILLQEKNKEITSSILSLKKIHENKIAHLEKIERVAQLLEIRADKINEYITLQHEFRKSDSLKFQLNNLTEFIQSAYLRSDDQMFKQENKISATTITDTLSDNGNVKSSKNNFWNKLFGKKKAPVVKEVQHFILEQLNVSLDTLQLMHDDSVYHRLVSTIEAQQHKRNAQLKQLYAKKELLFLSTNALFTEVLSHIETLEGLDNTNVANINVNASEKIDKSLSEMTLLLWGFGIIILVLGILVVFDLIKSNQYKEALKLASIQAADEAAAKQAFLSNMSHELRSPLQSIIGYTELLKNDSSYSNNNKVEVIDEASKHLLDVVNHFLDHSAVLNKDLALHPTTSNLRDLFDNVYNLMLVQASHKNLNLEYHVPDNVNDLFVYSDSFRLKQVLLNLLHNAVKYTNAGTIIFSIDIISNKGDVLLNIKVSDTGVGIPADKLEKIFLPYEQVAVSDNKNGTGLGLSIVKQIVDVFNGVITVDSKLGLGTTFNVQLSLKQVWPKIELPTIDEYTLDKNLVFNNAHLIWIIDDDTVLLSYYKSLLEFSNIQYQIFNDPMQIINASVPPNLSLVLMDIRMPHYVGYDLIHIIKQKIIPEQNVVFVAVTGQVLPNEISKAIENGFVDVLQKPFDGKQLKKMLLQYLPSLQPNNGENKDSSDDELNNLLHTNMREDIKTLSEACLQADMQNIHLLLHTHASRLAQFGYKELGLQARKLEMHTKEGQIPLQSIINYIDKLEKIFV